jgi:transcriptional regulator with XRE-family HTH domain
MATTDYPRTPLGELLTDALRRSGLSQNKVAQRVGMSTSNWNNIVYGGRELKGRFDAIQIRNEPERIARVAFVLGVNIEDALALRGYTLDDIPRVIRYDLSHVPAKQLQAELDRRERQPQAARDSAQVAEHNAEVFEQALDAVEHGQPQPPAPPEWRHAGA